MDRKQYIYKVNIKPYFIYNFLSFHLDHVGMILKYSNGEIVLFESTGKEGVGLCRWRTFKKNNWHHLYSK